jgi:repressor LexA
MELDLDALSKKQRDILQVIRDWVIKHGLPPTIREIGNAVGISSTSVVNYNLNKLMEGGYIVRSRTVSRGLRLHPQLDAQLGAEKLDPYVLRVPHLGQIVAGRPVPTYSDEIGDERTIPSTLIGSHDPAKVYTLTVKGDSMIDAMIKEGDMVILKHQDTARNGEMVAAWLKDREETTLKYFYDEGERIRLQPANPTMDPIYVEKKNLQIQGRVLAVIRRIS